MALCLPRPTAGEPKRSGPRALARALSSRSVLYCQSGHHVAGLISSQKEGVKANGMNPPLRFFNTTLFLPFPTDQILSEGASVIRASDLRGEASSRLTAKRSVLGPRPTKGPLPGHCAVRLSRRQGTLGLPSGSEAGLGKDAAQWGWRQGAARREVGH